MRSWSKTQSTHLWKPGKYIYAKDPKRGAFTKSADPDESGSALFATISTLLAMVVDKRKVNVRFRISFSLV